MEQNHNLARDEGEFFDEPEKYQRLVGHFAVIKLELSYAIHTLAQFLQAP